jgi:hypothetical protein
MTSLRVVTLFDGFRESATSWINGKTPLILKKKLTFNKFYGQDKFEGSHLNL